MRNLLAKIVIGWMASLIGAGAVWAQSEHGEAIEPGLRSPFDIAKAIKLNKLSRDLRVDLNDTWKYLGIDPGEFGVCGGCEATIYRHDLDPTPGREVILKITASDAFCRFLVFARARGKAGAKRGWKLRGHIDHDFNRYQMARHHVVQAFGKNWLVVRGQEGSGSGYALYGETWFEVSKRGIRPVLHYSVEGHTYPGLGGLNWELKGRAVPLTSTRTRKPMVRVGFVVRYTAEGFEDSDFATRFINRRNAYYIWNRRSGEFVFTENRSTISEHEMNLIANVESEEQAPGVQIGGNTFYSGLKGFVGSGFEMFLRLNARRLLRMAQSANSPGKEWLRAFMAQCDNIPEKLALEEALQHQLPQSPKQR